MRKKKILIIGASRHDFIEIAKKVRRNILSISYQAQVGHVGSALSVVEILVALYFAILRINPKKPKDEKRDRFILSKAHAAPALFAVLFQKGFISKKILFSYCQNGGQLEEHPAFGLPGIELSTGSLGHGLSVSAGMALAAKIKKKSWKVYDLISDAECDEGEIWEAALFASHHKLDNLTVLLDYNKVQAFGTVREVLNLEPLKDKWQSFGWKVLETDGHNINQIVKALKKGWKNKPLIIICHTIRGKGVSFMEHKIEWHYLNPTREQYIEALKEIGIPILL